MDALQPQMAIKKTPKYVENKHVTAKEGIEPVFVEEVIDISTHARTSLEVGLIFPAVGGEAQELSTLSYTHAHDFMRSTAKWSSAKARFHMVSQRRRPKGTQHSFTQTRAHTHTHIYRQTKNHTSPIMIFFSEKYIHKTGALCTVQKGESVSR
jgi:hypothetical protein